MIRVTVEGDGVTAVESCPQCEGTFLDAGEFTGLGAHALRDLVRQRRR